MKIVFTGGGTAGHIYPALAVAEYLPDAEKIYIGGNGIEKEILSKQNDFKYYQIPTVKFQRKLTLSNLLIPFKLSKSVKICKNLLKKLNPDAVFSKGGYVSLPVVYAAKKLKIPIISHECDMSLGLANRLILRKCDVMCTTFEETAKRHKNCVYTGQPLRKQITNGKKINFFNNNKPYILVLGGSLGAKFLNEIVYNNLDKLLENYNIIHICGKSNKQIEEKYGYKLIPYAENIEDLYKTADIVVSRAGSGVINELLSNQKPMLLIPLSKKCSRGDQIENAKEFEKKNFARILYEEDYNFEKFEKEIKFLLKNKSKFAENTKITNKKPSAKIIAEIIKNHIKWFFNVIYLKFSIIFNIFWYVCFGKYIEIFSIVFFKAS